VTSAAIIPARQKEEHVAVKLGLQVSELASGKQRQCLDRIVPQRFHPVLQTVHHRHASRLDQTNNPEQRIPVSPSQHQNLSFKAMADDCRPEDARRMEEKW
jgi:hypothetical protein